MTNGKTLELFYELLQMVFTYISKLLCKETIQTWSELSSFLTKTTKLLPTLFQYCPEISTGSMNDLFAKLSPFCCS